MKVIAAVAIALLLSSCASTQPTIYAPTAAASVEPEPELVAPVQQNVYSAPTYKLGYSSGSRVVRYIRGPRGGCYYINSNGNKTYVARSLCR